MLRRVALGLLVAMAACAACNAITGIGDLTTGEDCAPDAACGPAGDGAPGSVDGKSPVAEGGPVPDGQTSTIDGSFSQNQKPPTWDGLVPACIPIVPGNGVFYGVVGGAPGSTPACPTGYSPAKSGVPSAVYGGIYDDDLLCGVGSCACGPVGDRSPQQRACSPRLSYYQEATCTSQGSGFNPGDTLDDQSCRRVHFTGGNQFMKLVPTFDKNSAVCPPSGEAESKKQDPAFGLELHFCSPSGPAPDCTGGGLTAAPAAKDVIACYASSDGTCNGIYGTKVEVSTDETMSDTRACGCACGQPEAGACDGGTYSAGTSQGDCTTFTFDTACHSVVDLNNMYAKLVTAPAVSGASCAVKTQKTGAVSPAQKMVLCCLSRCTSCKLQAASTGGACATQSASCTADKSCNDYRTCANTCVGAACNDCLADISADAGLTDGAVPDASLGVYDTLIACENTACPTECN